MEGKKSRITLANVIRIILIVSGILIIGGVVFTFFKVHVEADEALRNAKNVRMALRSADIEMYAVGKTIFNPSNKNGIEDGVDLKVESLIEPKGVYSITSYSSKAHELTGMTYREKNYVVYFTKNGDDITWDVNLILNIFHYDDTDVSGE